MTPRELAEKAVQTLRNGNTETLLVVPRRINGAGRIRVLYRKGMKSVYGEPTTENADGHAVVAVKALDILAWLAAAGLVEVRGATDGKRGVGP